MARRRDGFWPVSYTHLDVYKRQLSGQTLSTDNLWPRGGPRYVSQRRGPRRREDTLILDRQLQLQELAAMAAENIAGKQPILLCVSLDCVLHVVVIAQSIAFDQDVYKRQAQAPSLADRR